MKKIIIFMFSVVLLGSCSNCFVCEQNTAGNKAKFDVCSNDFNSKEDWLNNIESLEDTDSVSITCRRRLF